MNVIKTENVAKIAINKSLLKEYSNNNERIVYLNNGTEFQIQVFNPYSYIIGVSFEFNDNINLNNQLLVVRPGERVWLDRYLDRESKFLFSTYEVGNSQAVKEAIKNNGKICIKIYKEKENNNYLISSWPDNNIYYNLNDNIDNIKLYNSTCYDNSSFKLNNDINDNIKYCDCNLNLSNFNSDITSAATYSVQTSSCTASASTNANTTTAKYNKPRSKSIETGRIENGSHSNQKFQNTYKDFESWPFRTEIIKLLPKSQKPIYKNDLTKLYCTNCGRKINTKFKYCPYCGAKTI